MIVEPNPIRRTRFDYLRHALIVLTTLGVAGTAEGSSVSVTTTAALEGNFGLQVSLAESQSTEAWIAIGPEKGLQAENAVHASFLIDPTHVIIKKRWRRRRRFRRQLCFLSLSQELGPTGSSVALCLEKDRLGAWLASAWLRDDTSQGYIHTGWVNLTGSASPGQEDPGEPLPARIEIEWGAASQPGAHDVYFRLFRTLDGQRNLLIDRVGLANGTQTVSYLQVGVVSQTARRISGELYLDSIEIERTPASPPP